MDKHLAIPLAAAFGNADHAPISNNTVRRGRRAANNAMRARNYETRAIMGGPGRVRSRSRSRNRRPLHLPGLTSNIELGAVSNNGPNSLNYMSSPRTEDPFGNYHAMRRIVNRRARSPSIIRHTHRRPYNRDPSLNRTNASRKETEIVQYISEKVKKNIINYEARYGATLPRYIFVYDSDLTNAIGTGSKPRTSSPLVDVFIHIPPNWKNVMDKYYKTIHVHPATSTLGNLKTLRERAYTADEVKTAINTSHYNV